MSSYSNYSTGTVRDTETDTVSYFGMDTMVWTNRWTQFYSTGTVRRVTDTDTASYCSVDIMVGTF